MVLPKIASVTSVSQNNFSSAGFSEPQHFSDSENCIPLRARAKTVARSHIQAANYSMEHDFG